MSGLPQLFRYVIWSLSFGIISGLLLCDPTPALGQSEQTDSELECSECHSETGWTPLSSGRTFSHSTTVFPLEGRHASVQCRDCHTGSSYEEIHNFQAAETECASCHIDIHDGQLGVDCESCHEPTNWTSARTAFNHDETQFPLVGAHKAIDCQSCHDLSDPVSIANVPLDCFGCHDSDYNSALEPNHVDSQFPTDCEMCHDVNATAWTQSEFDHDLTVFPLEGTHNQVTCTGCHSGTNFSTQGQQCISCHQEDYNIAEVNHENAGFNTICAACHSVTQWTNVTWSHLVETEYPLEGEHVSVTCLDCHIDNNFEVTESCNECHDPLDYENIVDHTAAFETYDECEDCHPGPEGWSPSTWDHNIKTDFTLTGAHVSETCLSCHTENTFNIVSTCYSCHQSDYESTAGSDFDHVAQEIPTDCEACHNTADWGDATFDHDQTNFPLTGEHTNVTCQECHSSGIYDGLATTCESCHIDDFDGTANPPHTTAGFTAANCEACHNTSSFVPSTWEHDSETDFTIDGAHVSQSCNSCHDGTWIDYSPTTETTCYTCHQQDYDEEPVHAQQNFGTNCLDCHTTSTFEDAEFDHLAFFPIYTGSHAGTWDNCSTCHIDQNDRTVFTCITSGCHDNESELNQEHQEEGVSGYAYDSNACYTCHPTGSTDDAFDHATTGFPLDGQHVTLQCAACHINNDYETQLNSDCVACHEDNFDQTSNPVHTDAGFDTQCADCHNTAGFQPATWDHGNSTGFTLQGDHADETCNDCHATSEWSGYQTAGVTCATCHTDDYNATTSPNHQDGGFSTSCQECHSSFTTWTGAEFDHSFYPLSSDHNNVECSECHTEANFQPSCMDCHTEDFFDEHDSGDPTDCWDCHNTFDWDDAEDDDDRTINPRKKIMPIPNNPRTD